MSLKTPVINCDILWKLQSLTVICLNVNMLLLAAVANCLSYSYTLELNLKEIFFLNNPSINFTPYAQMASNLMAGNFNSPALCIYKFGFGIRSLMKMSQYICKENVETKNYYIYFSIVLQSTRCSLNKSRNYFWGSQLFFWFNFIGTFIRWIISLELVWIPEFNQTSD